MLMKEGEGRKENIDEGRRRKRIKRSTMLMKEGEGRE